MQARPVIYTERKKIYTHIIISLNLDVLVIVNLRPVICAGESGSHLGSNLPRPSRRPTERANVLFFHRISTSGGSKD